MRVRLEAPPGARAGKTTTRGQTLPHHPTLTHPHVARRTRASGGRDGPPETACASVTRALVGLWCGGRGERRAEAGSETKKRVVLRRSERRRAQPVTLSFAPRKKPLMSRPTRAALLAGLAALAVLRARAK